MSNWSARLKAHEDAVTGRIAVAYDLEQALATFPTNVWSDGRQTIIHLSGAAEDVEVLVVRAMGDGVSVCFVFVEEHGRTTVALREKEHPGLVELGQFFLKHWSPS